MQEPTSSSGNATDAEQQEAVKRFWNERHQDADAESHDNFLAHPFVQSYVSLRAFGVMVGHLDAALQSIRENSRPGDRILSIGCGTADKEIVVARAFPDRQFEAIDLADDIVAMARERVRAAGIQNLEIRSGNFNELELGEDRYQLLLGLGALHHVENLENFWQQARRGLRPGGAVLAQEYIGPNRFQWTEAQMQACNEALESLVPEEHKPHHRHVGRIPVEELVRLDPSEAVRSAEILPTAAAAGLHLHGFASAGGALLQPVLMHQIATYDPQNWQHNLVLAKLFAAEERLMKNGVLGDDFGMFVLVPQ